MEEDFAVAQIADSIAANFGQLSLTSTNITRQVQHASY
jgi:hypothetical protein